MGLRIAFTTHLPGSGIDEVWLDYTREAKGFGRVDCKYCYKKTRAELGGFNQIVCSECGSGLSPDFHSLKALKMYMDDGDLDKAEETDKKSEEYRKWVKNPFYNGEVLYRIPKKKRMA